jgi:hypothetical protein
VLLSIRAVAFFVLASAPLLAGPPDFGQQELRAAIAEHHLPLTIETELNLNQPETFVTTPVGSTSIRVSGGDLRGLMYGLLDATDQVRSGNAVVRKTGEPGFRIRSVRIAPSDAELTAPGFYSSDRWIKIFEMLARNRINRITFVMPMEQIEYDRARFLTQLAHDYAVDFHLGIRPAAGGRVTLAQLRKVLDECVLIRGIQLDAGREPVEYFRTVAFPAVQQTGRRVTLDLRGAEMRPDVIRAGNAAGVVLNIAGRNSTSSLDEPFYSAIAVASTAEPTDVPSRLTALANAGAAGFELDLSGSNLENYERIYWAWGRAGYDHRSPGLAPGKPDPVPTKAPAPAKSTTRKK